MCDHRARYKNTGLDAKELRRRREEDSFQLRRQKREDVLSKRRTLAPLNAKDDMINDSESNETNFELSKDFSITKEVIDSIMQDEDQQILLEYAAKVRKILSREPQPPFDGIIQSGLIPRFVQLLERWDNPKIQFEVAWILTNICSGTSEQTRVVVDHGSIPKLINLLSSPDMSVCEQAVWALGNIVGDGPSCRDLVIQHGFVPALLALIRPGLDIGFLRNETWVLVNLCRSKEPPPSFEVVEQLIPALDYLIQMTDLAVLIDTTWAVSYITELGPTYSQLIIDSGLVKRMTPLLSNEELKVQTAAIRALGSIVTGSDEQTQAVIDAGALPHLRGCLKGNKDKIVKEALWFLSNITAGSTNQIQALIDNQIIPRIVFYLEHGDFSQQKEAAWAIYNMSLTGNPEQIKVLVDENAIPPLCNMLNLKDNGVVDNILQTLACILNAYVDTGETNDICEIIESCGGLDKIEQLQSSENAEIYHHAYTIIEQFFSVE